MQNPNLQSELTNSFTLAGKLRINDLIESRLLIVRFLLISFLSSLVGSRMRAASLPDFPNPTRTVNSSIRPKFLNPLFHIKIQIISVMFFSKVSAPACHVAFAQTAASARSDVIACGIKALQVEKVPDD